MNGLIFDIDVPYFACFRKPTSNSAVHTYLVPPFTTILGVLSNAIGLKRDDFSLQDVLQIGISPLRSEKPVKEKALLIKNARNAKENIRAFWSSPYWRDFLVMPYYRVYLKGYEDIIACVYDKLLCPERPLYIGQSDDMAIIDNLKAADVCEATSDTVYSVVEGIYNGCELAKLPYRFIKNGDALLYTPTLSIPPSVPMKLPVAINGYYFNDEFVQLF